MFNFIKSYFKRCKIPTKQEIQEYYQKYLLSHRHPGTKVFHFIGNMWVLGSSFSMILRVFSYQEYWWLLFLPFWMWFGIYFWAWPSHKWIEKNSPATFKANPLLTKICDWKMNYELLTGKLKWDTRTLFRNWGKNRSNRS